MFAHNKDSVRLGILFLSAMLLMGFSACCPDNDGDGYGDPASTSCPHPEHDCHDFNADVYPDAPEICDGMDNQCPGDEGYGLVDESPVCCPDNDGDGYGDPATAACPHPELDCDDNNADIYPGAPDICDGIDNQCPGDTGYGLIDEDCQMTLIPAGCFDMGDSFGEGGPGELPVHNVCLSEFWMDVHEVTNAEFAECVDAGVCGVPEYPESYTRPWYYGNPAYDNHPVIWIQWSQALEYCVWAEKRLPTEAEWEYAARGGLTGMRFPWGGSSPDPYDDVDCNDANYGRWDPGDPCYGHAGLNNDTHGVGKYPANGYGLYDMAGNVWEFVNDWYGLTYYQYCVDNGIVDDPPGPASGTEPVIRGSSWESPYIAALRVAFRFQISLYHTWYALGFRCAR